MWKRKSATASPTGKTIITDAAAVHIDRHVIRNPQLHDYACDEHVPPSVALRWVIRRKAAIVRAVRNGELSVEEARCRYMLSAEELLGWQRSLERHGLAGLRTTRINHYRRAASS